MLKIEKLQQPVCINMQSLKLATEFQNPIKVELNPQFAERTQISNLYLFSWMIFGKHWLCGWLLYRKLFKSINDMNKLEKQLNGRKWMLELHTM